MKFSVSVTVGKMVVACEVEGESAEGASKQLESGMRELQKLMEGAISWSDQLKLESRGFERPGQSASDLLASRIGVLQQGSKVDQLVALLYGRFLVDATSSLSPAEIKRAFSGSGLLAPVNINDTVFKALQKGWITRINEKGEYRLTTPGQKHAESLLRSSSKEGNEQ